MVQYRGRLSLILKGLWLETGGGGKRAPKCATGPAPEGGEKEAAAVAAAPVEAATAEGTPAKVLHYDCTSLRFTKV